MNIKYLKIASLFGMKEEVVEPRRCSGRLTRFQALAALHRRWLRAASQANQPAPLNFITFYANVE